MKRLIKYLFLCLIIFSCSDDNGRKSESSEFLGKWKLTQTLFDPGDGSGVFVDVDSNDNREIEFSNNGNVISNYSLCLDNPTPGNSFTAPYFADEDYIIPNDCFPVGYNIEYRIQGENLILSYPCVEGCLFKFVRIE